MLREWSKDAILRDDVCTAQCGFLLRNNGGNSGGFIQNQHSTLNTDLIPPPARHIRTRQLNNNNKPRQQNNGFNVFNGFKFPDLSPFIAK